MSARMTAMIQKRVVIRFWIIAVILALIGLSSLKLR